MSALVTQDSWCAKLRETRTEKGISQQAMAAATGIRQPRISQIENGLVDPKLSEVILLSETLDYVLFLPPRKYLEDVEYTIKECFLVENRDTLPKTIPQAILGDRYWD